jgi:hypothetical protein
LSEFTLVILLESVLQRLPANNWTPTLGTKLELYRFAYSAFAGGTGRGVQGGLLDQITKIGESEVVPP